MKINLIPILLLALSCSACDLTEDGGYPVYGFTYDGELGCIPTTKANNAEKVLLGKVPGIPQNVGAEFLCLYNEKEDQFVLTDRSIDIIDGRIVGGLDEWRTCQSVGKRQSRCESMAKGDPVFAYTYDEERGCIPTTGLEPDYLEYVEDLPPDSGEALICLYNATEERFVLVNRDLNLAEDGSVIGGLNSWQSCESAGQWQYSCEAIEPQ